MPIPQHTLAILEFDKVRERLAEHTAFAASREMALALVPSDEPLDVRRALQATDAARLLYDNFPEVTIGGARDIRAAVRKAQRGGIMEPLTLLDVAATLGSMRQLRTRLLRLPEDHYLPLIDLAWQLVEREDIEATIERTVDPGGNILDSASPALRRIRGEIRVAYDRLMDRLNGILQSSQYASALQEPIITVRDGRYVLPIKASGRRTLRGVVHDQSNSGATLFVEPLQTVELNNRWRELQLAEQEEIERILREISDSIAADGERIVHAVDALAELDLLFAKGRYSAALDGVAPEIVEASTSLPDRPGQLSEGDDPEALPDRPEDAPLYLRRARHPLLDRSTVVPTNVWLGGSFRVLLITGPNTGGKTVALKTTGLMALMAQAGMHIPADLGSRLPVLRRIFADIGDEQSIEQSLSTFSSHMRNIIAILRILGMDPAEPGSVPDSLVLLDELGAGTDPTEGAALARSIVERMLHVGAMCIATTHYAELKVFAHNTPGVINGSVEFDQETLRPTYKLMIGLPGRSNALAIATRLGLQPELVERARSFLSAENEQVEDLLASIAREREEAAAELGEARERRVEAERAAERLREEQATFEREREQRLEAYERELDQQLRGARQELRRLRDDMRSVSLTREWLQQAEDRLRTVGEEAEQGRRGRQQHESAGPPPQQPPRPLQPGDRVHVASVKLDGELLAVDENTGEAEVQVGGFRMTVDLRELRRLKGSAPPERRAPAVAAPAPSRDVSMQLDMRGMRAAEVEALLERYLNDAYLSNLTEVRLVHGKGTGALRKIVRDTLSSHPLVASFAGGIDGEGGDGVTVAKLQRR